MNDNRVALSDLELIPNSELFFDYYTFDGVEHYVSLFLYSDPRYEYMEPVYCGNIFGTDRCLVLIGNTFGVPIMNHFGDPNYYPVKICDWFVQHYKLY